MELLDSISKCHEKVSRLKDKIKQWEQQHQKLDETEKPWSWRKLIQLRIGCLPSLLKRKFQAQDSQVMFSNLSHSHSLNCMDRETLERQVTLEEIKEAVWDCGSSKAPGPDGYSFAFVKKYWGTIQKVL
ncbi:hypothetical protein Tco_0773259 [Tanacetum coccineum]|uniref:RNA-directed DNA polymerase (Reverse transcriptase) n=1 Tax=Tanacetum coccineum TaxID=301880 RepID=A0ABQ4ZPA1_9ASTR